MVSDSGPARTPRQPPSPLLQTLRLWERRAGRGVGPSAEQAAEWHEEVESARSRGSSEIRELIARLASIEISILANRQPSGGPLAPSRGADMRTRLDRIWNDLIDLGSWGKLRRSLEPAMSRLIALQAQIDRTEQPAGPRAWLGRQSETFVRTVSRLSRLGSVRASLGQSPLRGALGWRDETPLSQGLFAFLRERQRRTDGFLASLGRHARIPLTPGAYPGLDLPLWQLTEVQLDWLEDEVDPWERPDVVERLETSAAPLRRQGIVLAFVRGEAVPAERYDEAAAQFAADFHVPGPLGPISLESIDLLDRAIPVMERPGHLSVVLAPGAVEKMPTGGPHFTRGSSPPAAGDSSSIARSLLPQSTEATAPSSTDGTFVPTFDAPRATRGFSPTSAARSSVSIERKGIGVGASSPITRPTALVSRGGSLARGEGSRRFEGETPPAAVGADPTESGRTSGDRPELQLSPLSLILAPPSEIGAPSPTSASAFASTIAATHRSTRGTSTSSPLASSRSPVPLSPPATDRDDSSTTQRTIGDDMPSRPDLTERIENQTQSSGRPPAQGIRLHSAWPVGLSPTIMPESTVQEREQRPGANQVQRFSLLSVESPIGQDPDEAPVVRTTAPGTGVGPETGKGVGPPASAMFPPTRSSPTPRTQEVVRITLDWIAGEDPWQPEPSSELRLDAAREAARDLEAQGLIVQFERGREVVVEQYESEQARSATEFTIPTTAGPVVLSQLVILDGANTIAQRPGQLRVLIAPRDVRQTRSQAARVNESDPFPRLSFIEPDEPRRADQPPVDLAIPRLRSTPPRTVPPTPADRSMSDEQRPTAGQWPVPTTTQRTLVSRPAEQAPPRVSAALLSVGMTSEGEPVARAAREGPLSPPPALPFDKERAGAGLGRGGNAPAARRPEWAAGPGAAAGLAEATVPGRITDPGEATGPGAASWPGDVARSREAAGGSTPRFGPDAPHAIGTADRDFPRLYPALSTVERRTEAGHALIPPSPAPSDADQARGLPDVASPMSPTHASSFLPILLAQGVGPDQDLTDASSSTSIPQPGIPSPPLLVKGEGRGEGFPNLSAPRAPVPTEGTSSPMEILRSPPLVKGEGRGEGFPLAQQASLVPPPPIATSPGLSRLTTAFTPSMVPSAFPRLAEQPLIFPQDVETAPGAAGADARELANAPFGTPPIPRIGETAVGRFVSAPLAAEQRATFSPPENIAARRDVRIEVDRSHPPDQPQLVEVIVDWIAGQDPWRRPEVLERAREAVHPLTDRGIELRFIRGREWPAEQYQPSLSQRASDFVVVGSAEPIPLEAVELLERAVLVAIRPGSLQVLVAPDLQPSPRVDRPLSSTALPMSLVRQADASGEEARSEATTPFLSATTRGPVGGSRLERLVVIVDWIAGQDPWSAGCSPEPSAGVADELARHGIRLELVRGRALPTESYQEDLIQSANAFVVVGPRGRVTLGNVPLFDRAVPVLQRPGEVRVIAAPRRPVALAPTDRPSLALNRPGSLEPVSVPPAIASRPTAGPRIDSGPAETTPLVARDTLAVVASPALREGAPIPSTSVEPRRTGIARSRASFDEPTGTSLGRPSATPIGPAPLTAGSYATLAETTTAQLGERRDFPYFTVAAPLGGSVIGPSTGELVQRSADPSADLPVFQPLSTSNSGGGTGPSVWPGVAPLVGPTSIGATAAQSTSPLSIVVFDVGPSTDDPSAGSAPSELGPFVPTSPSLVSRVETSSKPTLSLARPREEARPRREAVAGYATTTSFVFVHDSDSADETSDQVPVARARIDRPTVSGEGSTGPMISRSPQTEPADETTSSGKGPDLDALARKVYGEIKWRLAVERERSGASRVFRG